VGIGADRLLAVFGKRRAEAVAAYIQFVEQGANKSAPWEKLKNQIYLGSDEFVGRVFEKVKRPDELLEVPAKQKRGPALPLKTYAEHALDRDSAIQAAFASGGYTMREIGSYFGLHYSRVSRILKARGKT